MNKDIIFDLYMFLDTKSICNCSQSNKLFHEVYNNEYFWKSKFNYDFNENIDPYKQLFGLNNKETYIKYYMINNLITKLKLNNNVLELYNSEKFSYFYKQLIQIPKEIGMLNNLQQ